MYRLCKIENLPEVTRDLMAQPVMSTFLVRSELAVKHVFSVPNVYLSHGALSNKFDHMSVFHEIECRDNSPLCARAVRSLEPIAAEGRKPWQGALSPGILISSPLRCASAPGFSGKTVDVSIDFADDDDAGEGLSAAPPPTDGRIEIAVTKDEIRRLDLSAAHAVLRKYVHQIGDNATVPPSDPKELLDRTVGFVLDYELDDPLDPRELSELPDIRLWFVRLDAAYPWLPVALDWRAGELARYAAMLVPHQMSKRMGVVYNPEALELFVMNKVFLLHPWLNVIGVPKPKAKLNDMLRMLGFSVTDELYEFIEYHTPP